MLDGNTSAPGIQSLAVVRGCDEPHVKTALCDLVRYGRMTFILAPRKCDPAFADNILTHVMKGPLKACCEFAAIVPMADDAVTAIRRVRKIHPPAHVVIVGPVHEIFNDTVRFVDMLPELDFTMPKVVEGTEHGTEHGTEEGGNTGGQTC